MHSATKTNGNESTTMSISRYHGATGRMDLSTKAAVITGGARGIGAAVCHALVRERIKAIGLVDVSDDVMRFATEFNSEVGREAVVPFRGDVTDASFRRGVFSALEGRFGSVSICVPAAGITRDKLAVRVDREAGTVEVYPEADWERVLAVDLTAPIYWALETVASVARERLKRGLKRWEPAEPLEGAIIFIGSVSSAGNRGQVSYATAKAGLEGAQATLAAEAIFHGVRSAIIHPGYTDTAMVRALGEEFIQQRIIPQTQLRRLIRPEEIADAICFMICNAAVSGKVWVDAGWHPVA
ncbi:3-oxoacyl-[acyl-carrier-protein] reductase FabG [Phycisphaerae bacterium RAS1]|nr:3-oxoacyl-[acyl-carrier-protein] reductase FabG [Phycisphaerae bacterium RAS1]